MKIGKSLKIASDLCSGLALIFIIEICICGFGGFLNGFNSGLILWLFVCVVAVGGFGWVSYDLKKGSKIGVIIGFILLGLLTCSIVYGLINHENGITGTFDFWFAIIMLLILFTTGTCLVIAWDELN